MDYFEMNQGSWSFCLARFKDLLRPDGVSRLGVEEESAVEAARADSSAPVKLATITAVLPNLVFEGYHDWYVYQDEWVLRNLGHVLTTQEEYEILSRLDQNTPQSLLEVLAYIADERLSAWQNAAREEFAESSSQNGPGVLAGFENGANWHASRTPGTYYYTYVDDRYLYSDLPEAPMSEWETLPVRERLATENAGLWGDDGWYYTPTGDPGLYSGAFVYAADREGPWLTEEAALAQRQATALRPVPDPARYDLIKRVDGYPDWAFGLDTEESVWKYARVTASGLPDDTARWFAVDDLNEDGTEYFVGPGYSATGWLQYQVSQGEEAAVDGGELEDPQQYAQQLVRELSEEILADLVAQHLSEQGQDDVLAELLGTRELDDLKSEIARLTYDAVREELGYEYA